MASSSAVDLIFWGNICAVAAIIFYGYIALMQMRGIFKIPRRWMTVIRFGCVCLLMAPIAARYQFSQLSIIYLSSAICLMGAFIKLKNRSGM